MALALASRSTLIAPSATLAMAAEARKLKAQGVAVLDFALGEPDFHTPANIQEAAIRAMQSGQTHYTPPAGIPELRAGRGGPLHPTSTGCPPSRLRSSSPTAPSIRSTTH